LEQPCNEVITLKVKDGDYFKFDKISCIARKCRIGAKPVQRTHDHRGQFIAIEDGECYIDRAWRAK